VLNLKYILYKTTNGINGKIYIGCHQTEDIYDNYMGSGKILKRAIKKYGIENFTKEILECFDDPDDMFSMESKVVNEDFVKRADTYNIKTGGYGGWTYLNSGSDKHIERCRKAGKKTYEKGLKLWNESNDHEIKKQRSIYAGNTFRGRKHTEESKKKISESQKKHDRIGDKNPMYGKCWIYNDELKISKRIDNNDLINWTENGWIKGRKMSFP